MIRRINVFGSVQQLINNWPTSWLHQTTAKNSLDIRHKPTKDTQSLELTIPTLVDDFLKLALGRVICRRSLLLCLTFFLVFFLCFLRNYYDLSFSTEFILLFKYAIKTMHQYCKISAFYLVKLPWMLCKLLRTLWLNFCVHFSFVFKIKFVL